MRSWRLRTGSANYLAPLIESLRLMLPVGLSQRGRTVFRRTPAGAGRAVGNSRRCWHGSCCEPADWAEITAEVNCGVTQRDDLDPLIEMGLVVRDVAFPFAAAAAEDGSAGAPDRVRGGGAALLRWAGSGAQCRRRAAAVAGQA